MNRTALAKVAARMVRLEVGIVSQDENIKAAEADNRENDVHHHRGIRTEYNCELIGISETLHDLGFRYEGAPPFLTGWYFGNHVQGAVAEHPDEPDQAIADVLDRLIELAPGEVKR